MASAVVAAAFLCGYGEQWVEALFNNLFVLSGIASRSRSVGSVLFAAISGRMRVMVTGGDRNQVHSGCCYVLPEFQNVLLLCISITVN